MFRWDARLRRKANCKPHCGWIQTSFLLWSTSDLMVSAERPENHMNLALLYVQMGRTTEAESELQTALRLDPNFVPAMVNLRSDGFCRATRESHEPGAALCSDGTHD